MVNNPEENQQVNRDFKGIWIPREIWLCEGLSAMEKCLWAEIDSLYSKEKKGCYASNEYLANFMGVKERTVRDALCKLRQLKLIEDVSFNGRERVIKALPVDDDFPSRLADWRKSATLHGENPPPCPADNRHPLYIDNKVDNKEDNNTPPTSSNQRKSKQPASQDSASAEGVSFDSSPKPKKEKPPAAFSAKVKEITAEMIAIARRCSPVYREPDKLDKFYEQVALMLEKDQQDPKILLRAFEWACSDTVERDSFKGWQGIVCSNKKRGGKVSNPAEKFRDNFTNIHAQMISQPVRKFAPSSNDEASLAKWKEAEKRAL